MNFDFSLLEKLTDPGPRLPWIKKWLIEEIWSPSHYKQISPIEYLKSGEDAVNKFETTWMNTVQQIKNKKRIIITSDHGYIFFGTGMDFPRTSPEMKEMNDYFGNDRHAFLLDKPKPPQSDDIVLDTSRQVALVKGRVRTRSTGEAAARLYKHGGLSLMEMLTPWVVLTSK